MGCVSVMLEAARPEGTIRDWLSLPLAPAELERQLDELGAGGRVEVVAVSVSVPATELRYSHAWSDTARDLNALALAIESTLADSHALAFAGAHARQVAERQGREPRALDYAGGVVRLWRLAGDAPEGASQEAVAPDVEGVELACEIACANRRRHLVAKLPGIVERSGVGCAAIEGDSDIEGAEQWLLSDAAGAVSWLSGTSDQVEEHDRRLATMLRSLAREARALYGDGPLSSLGAPAASCAAHVRPSAPDWLADQLAEQASQEVAQYESERTARRRKRRARRGEGHGR